MWSTARVKGPCDFLSPAGFLWAGCKLINDICCIFIWEIIDRGNDEMYVSSYIRTNPLHDLQKFTIQKRFRFQGHEDNPIWTLSRLVIWAILCEVEESLNLMGPCCASWGVPARGTSCRTFVNSYGLMHIPFVSDGNMTSARNLGCTRFGIDMRSSKAIGKYIHIALSHHIPSKDCSSTLPYPSKALLLVGGAACSITFSEVRSLRKILEPHMLCVLPKYFSWCIRFTSFCIFLKHINIYIYI